VGFGASKPDPEKMGTFQKWELSEEIIHNKDMR
jgi:hypothetical protein